MKRDIVWICGLLLVILSFGDCQLHKVCSFPSHHPFKRNPFTTFLQNINTKEKKTIVTNYNSIRKEIIYQYGSIELDHSTIHRNIICFTISLIVARILTVLDTLKHWENLYLVMSYANSLLWALKVFILIYYWEYFCATLQNFNFFAL